VANRVRDTPVWMFHGADDPLIPASESRRMAAALRALGSEVHYTELPGTGHNAWDPAYQNPELPLWLLRQRLPEQR
jgi:predicted peptidase